MSVAPRQNKMQYVQLGNSGLKVSRIILGCMSYGTKKWQDWVIEDQDEVNKHIQFAWESGITTFDTANVYSNGQSEVMLGKAIKQLNLPRDEVVVMTKLFSPVFKDVSVDGYTVRSEDFMVINQKGLNRKHIFDSVKASLERLQLDYIDVLQCHRFDATTPYEETMQGLHDVVKAGLVRYIGMSSCWAWQFAAMQNYAINNKLTPFISMQNHYNLVYREEEREMLPMLKHFGVGCIPWSPLARGVLTRPISKAKESARVASDFWASGYVGAGTEDVVNRVEELAKKKGLKMAQVAAAWSLSKSAITAPIVGSTKLDNLKEVVSALDVKLTDEEIAYLEEPYKTTAIFGHW